MMLRFPRGSCQARKAIPVLQLTYPGVYTQELSSGVRTVTGASTSVALFVGPTKTGIDGRARRCLSYADFERQFGGLHPTSSLSYSVLHFFGNGGGEAQVIRVPTKGAKPAKASLKQGGADDPSVTVTALSSGTSGNGLFLEIDRIDVAGPARFTLSVIDTVTGRVERFPDLTPAAADVRSADAIVDDPTTGSQLVELTVDARDKDAPANTGSVYQVTAPLATGPAAANLTVSVDLTPRKTDGTAGAPVTLADVTVISTGSTLPASPLELVTRLVTAINTALRADPTTHDTLGGVAVEGLTYSTNPLLLRLQVARPTGPVGAARVHDATVELKAPAGGTSFLTTYGIEPDKATINPSRYRLGSPYASAAVIQEQRGDDGDTAGQPDTTDLKAAITALDARDPFFNVLCLPDLVRPRTTDPLTPHHDNPSGVYAEAARVCGNKFAFLVVDPPPSAVDVGTAEAWKNAIGFASTHAGAWFPNLRVDNPLVPGSILSHPPSGAIAGVIARTDARVGVWGAPAGTDATIVGVYGPAVELSDAEQGVLNPIGLNAIRRFPIYQTVGFGSRTVDGADAVGSEWKYVPVRRTASHILRSLSEGLRWAVHKGNGPDLWTQLRVSCTAFMQGLYRQGAFKGTSPREAYFVACDGSTTTQADIDLGVVNIVIGFSPLKPAEFVVISLRQIVQPAA